MVIKAYYDTTALQTVVCSNIENTVVTVQCMIRKNTYYLLHIEHAVEQYGTIVLTAVIGYIMLNACSMMCDKDDVVTLLLVTYYRFNDCVAFFFSIMD
jgi:hypothetical protein